MDYLRLIPLLSCLLLLAACGEADEVNQQREPKGPSAPSAETSSMEPGEMRVPPSTARRTYTWQVPAGWTEVEWTSHIRLVSFSVPHGDEVGDLSVLELGGGAGGMLANLNRWRGQLGLEPVGVDAPEEAGQVTQAPAGTFTWWSIVNDEADPSVGMLAGMLEAPDHVMFVKLTGSSELVAASEAGFVEFLASFAHATGTS
jgi:hypothetical protein